MVFHVDLTPDTDAEGHAGALLDKEERARWHRFLHHRPQREYSLCRAALRVILCRQLGCRNDELSFGTSHYGKPFALVNGMRTHINFNISHSGQHGLIAIVPATRIGVDVEERVPRKGLEDTVGMILTPGERKTVARASGAQKIHLLYQLWTMKEALVKALGQGFSLDMTQFEIPPSLYHGTQSDIFQFPHLPESRWRLDNLGNVSFAAALALELDAGTKAPS